MIAGAASLSYGVYRTIHDAPEDVTSSFVNREGERVLITEREYNYKLNVFVPLGIGIGLSSLIPHGRKKAKFREALEFYNR